MNRFQSALDLIKLQLAKTDQNKEAFETLQELIDSVNVVDRPAYTLDHLFGDFTGDLDKLGLTNPYVLNEYDDPHKVLSGIEKTYTLEEAKELLELGDFDDLGTEMSHIKNHFDSDK
jgi:hypothetical protein